MDVTMQNQQLSICMTDSSSDQQSPHNDSHTNGKRKFGDTDISSDSDDGSYWKGGMKQLKRIASEIALHDRTTVRLLPDGSIVITPHPLPQLPSEIISLIIRHLFVQKERIHACTLVNKEFHNITNPLLWQEPTFRSKTPDHTDIKARFATSLSHMSDQRLSLIGHHIHKLRLDHGYFTEETQQLNRLLPHLTQLKRLAIFDSSNVTDTYFQHLPFHWQQLQSLQLIDTQLTKASFTAIGQHCRQLIHLDWHLSETQSVDWLQDLESCPLKLLEINSAISQLDDNTITTLKSFRGLTYLQLDMHSESIQQFLFSTTSTTTTKWWPQLTSIKLDPCNEIDDTLMIRFIQSYPQLEIIDVTEAELLTQKSLDAIVTWLPNLTRLNLLDNDHINADGIRQLIRGCTSLNDIYIDACGKISESDFPKLNLVVDEEMDFPEPMELNQQQIEKIRQGNA